MANGIGITTGLLDWEFQNSYVERAMDNAAYEAAHPDDTLVLAGPARWASLGAGATTGSGSMLAIGMLQSVQFNQTKPTQPMMAIGSGRSFFVSGKAQTQWTIGRLFVNGRNLLRVLYHNAIASQQASGSAFDVSKFDDPAAKVGRSKFFINLDSELYYIPFGLGCLFRTKMHDLVGSFYTELCMLNSYAIGFNAGQSMILEQVSGVADRVLPANFSEAGAKANVPRATVDEILNFTDAVVPDAAGMDGPQAMDDTVETA